MKTLKTLKEAKKAGLKTNVTLLYSDDINVCRGAEITKMVGILIQQKKKHRYAKNVIKKVKAADTI